MAENNNLYLINEIVKYASAYDKTENTQKPLVDSIQAYLNYNDFNQDYCIYVDDDEHIKIMKYNPPVEEEMYKDDIIPTEAATVTVVEEDAE